MNFCRTVSQRNCDAFVNSLSFLICQHLENETLDLWITYHQVHSSVLAQHNVDIYSSAGAHVNTRMVAES